MPRFTIGSLLAGLFLALAAVTVLHSWSGANHARAAVDTGRIVPPGMGPEPLAIDPRSGAISLGQAKANDYELDDVDSWDGGLDAATW